MAIAYFHTASGPIQALIVNADTVDQFDVTELPANTGVLYVGIATGRDGEVAVMADEDAEDVKFNWPGLHFQPTAKVVVDKLADEDQQRLVVATMVLALTGRLDSEEASAVFDEIPMVSEEYDSDEFESVDWNERRLLLAS